MSTNGFRNNYFCLFQKVDVFCLVKHRDVFRELTLRCVAAVSDVSAAGCVATEQFLSECETVVDDVWSINTCIVAMTSYYLTANCTYYIATFNHSCIMQLQTFLVKLQCSVQPDETSSTSTSTFLSNPSVLFVEISV